jgi:chromosome partitioning protein
MVKIVVVANPKGGAKKTTSTVNLAAAAALKGLKVGLADLDVQGHSALLSGLVSSDARGFASSMFCDEPKLASELMTPCEFGYDVILPGPEFIQAETWITNTPLGEQRLAMLFQRDRKLAEYDIVFIDTVGVMNQTFTSALLAADSLLIPLCPGEFSEDVLEKYIAFINTISPFRVRGKLQIDGLFFTDVDTRTQVDQLSMETVKAQYAGQLPIANTLIPHTTVVKQAEKLRMPVLLYKPDSQGAKAYLQLYDELFDAGARSLKREREVMDNA